MGISSALISNKSNTFGLKLNKAYILNAKPTTTLLNKNEKTINNSSGLLNNMMVNRFESSGKAIIYSLLIKN